MFWLKQLELYSANQLSLDFNPILSHKDSVEKESILISLLNDMFSNESFNPITTWTLTPNLFDELIKATISQPTFSLPSDSKALTVFGIPISISYLLPEGTYLAQRKYGHAVIKCIKKS